jgi:hypothetical protein
MTPLFLLALACSSSDGDKSVEYADLNGTRVQL